MLKEESSKRQRTSNIGEGGHSVPPPIHPGSQVRLVNLPAHPGLEGVIATVVSVEEDNFLQVEICKTKVQKRIKRDKVRPILIGCIVELHGLVAAYKLNGRIGECIAYDDEELFRYTILLSDGSTKKVKPENVKFMAKYDAEMVTKYQLDSLIERGADKGALRERVDVVTRGNRIVPDVISVRVLEDYLKLDSEELREKLLESKRVSIASLVGSDVKVLNLSLPRSRLVMSNEGEKNKMNVMFRNFLDSGLKGVEDHYKKQVYFIIPFLINRDLGLPLIDRAVNCSYPLFSFLADATVLVLAEDENLESLKSSTQRMDVWMASNVFDRDLFVFNCGGKAANWTREFKKSEIRTGLPSRGRSCEDDKLIKEIEQSISASPPSPSGGWRPCLLIN